MGGEHSVDSVLAWISFVSTNRFAPCFYSCAVDPENMQSKSSTVEPALETVNLAYCSNKFSLVKFSSETSASERGSG
jgi:hypothetical protein